MSSYEQQRARDLGQQALRILDAAAAEGRPPTRDERREVDDLLSTADAYTRSKGLPAQTWDGGFGRPLPLGGGLGDYSAPHAMSPGERFVTSDGYKAIKDAAGRPEQFSTGMIEITSLPPHLEMKGTLGELAQIADATRGPIGGGALVSVPQVVPGVVDALFAPLTIESLLLSGQANGPSIRFITEGTALSGAAGVPEGGTKPESTIGLVTTDEVLKKVATVLPISEEMLEDSPSVQAYLNGQLSTFVQVEAERQIFRGASGGAEVQGLLTSRNVPVYQTAGTTTDRAEQLFRAINSMRGSALVEADFVVMHPTDYQVLRLLKDSASQFYGGGPFLGAYGGQTMMTATGSVAGVQDSVWGKPVYVTPNIGGAGTALIGSTRSACVWSRGGLRVEASNSHDNYWTLNLVSLRAERRLALALYRPKGFLELRWAAGPGG